MSSNFFSIRFVNKNQNQFFKSVCPGNSGLFTTDKQISFEFIRQSNVNMREKEQGNFPVTTIVAD